MQRGVSSPTQKIKETLNKLLLCFVPVSRWSVVRSESSVRPVILMQSPEFLGTVTVLSTGKHREVQSNTAAMC